MRVSLLCTTGMGCLQFLEEGAQTVHRYYTCIMDTLIDLVKLVMI